MAEKQVDSITAGIEPKVAIQQPAATPRVEAPRSEPEQVTAQDAAIMPETLSELNALMDVIKETQLPEILPLEPIVTANGEEIDFENLDATAAGAGAGGGGDGSSFVRLLRILESVTPLQYEYSTELVNVPDFELAGVNTLNLIEDEEPPIIPPVPEVPNPEQPDTDSEDEDPEEDPPTEDPEPEIPPDEDEEDPPVDPEDPPVPDPEDEDPDEEDEDPEEPPPPDDDDDDEDPEEPPPPDDDDDGKGNNGVGNGEDPPPPGNPPENDGPGTGPGNPGNQGGTPGNNGNNGGPQGNNGFGNGDQDAPGNSGPNNNAENAGNQDASPEDYPGNSNKNGNNDVLNPADLLDDGPSQGGGRGNNFDPTGLLFELETRGNRPIDIE